MKTARVLQADQMAAALDHLERRLIAKAETLARSAAVARASARRNADAPWRSADLVWPLFTKG